MAGAVGFEPTVHGTKNRCLTTWPRPNCGGVFIQALAWVQGQNPTFLPLLRQQWKSPPEAREMPQRTPRGSRSTAGFTARRRFGTHRQPAASRLGSRRKSPPSARITRIRHRNTCSIRQVQPSIFDIVRNRRHHGNRRSSAGPISGSVFCVVLRDSGACVDPHDHLVTSTTSRRIRP